MNKFNELNDLEIKFIEDLISTYKYVEKNRQINTDIIFNLKNQLKINENIFIGKIKKEKEKNNLNI